METNNKTGAPGKILVTAGPTIEPLDPIRYISNYSTGTMGYEIAREGAQRGFDVCLVSGPVNLVPPPGVDVVSVQTACEMRDRVMEKIEGCDCLIMAAAVCDYRPFRQRSNKIKKTEKMDLQLVKNPDILMETGQRKGLVRIGFALETENPLENGRKKLKTKELDLIVVNTKGPEDPFGPGEKRFSIIDKNDAVREFEGLTKAQMAGIIMDEVERSVR